MKAETKTVYTAHDGTVFDTDKACRSYERDPDNIAKMVAALTVEEIAAALAGDDLETGDLLAIAGGRCAQARREKGVVKAHRRPNGPVAATAEP